MRAEAGVGEAADERRVAADVGPERVRVGAAGAGVDEPRGARVEHAVEEELRRARRATAGRARPRAAAAPRPPSSVIEGAWCIGISSRTVRSPRASSCAHVASSSGSPTIAVRAGQPDAVERAQGRRVGVERLGLGPRGDDVADEVHGAVLEQRAGRAARRRRRRSRRTPGSSRAPATPAERERRPAGERGVAVVEAEQRRCAAERLLDRVGADAGGVERLVADAVAEHPRAVAAAPPLLRPAGRGPRRASRALRRSTPRVCERAPEGMDVAVGRGRGGRSPRVRRSAPCPRRRRRGPRRRPRPRRSAPSRQAIAVAAGRPASSVRTWAPMIGAVGSGHGRDVSSAGAWSRLVLRPRRRAGPAAARRLALGRRLHRRRRLHRPLDRATSCARADPALDVVVLEAETAGFGASGRNGGWVLGALSGRREHWAERGGRAGAIAQAARSRRRSTRSAASSPPRGSTATSSRAARCTSRRRRSSSSAIVAEVEESHAWEGDDELLDAAATARAGRGRRRARRRVHAALRARPAGASSRAGSRTRPSAPARSSARGRARRGSPPAASTRRTGSSARRTSCARPRATRRGCPGCGACCSRSPAR